MSNQYFVTVYQPEDFPLVEIQIRLNENPLSGYIAARAQMEIVTRKLGFTVYPNVQFLGEKSPTGARAIAEWFTVAARTADNLERMVAGRDDLSRPIEARWVNDEVLMNFAAEDSEVSE